jgi:hypothetical protein
MLRRTLLSIWIGVFLLAGCAPGTAEPTFTDAQLATRVNQILTSMPTLTEEPQDLSPAKTIEPSPVPDEDTSPSPTDTLTPQSPTETSSPTEPPAESPTSTVAPTQTITPASTATFAAEDPRASLGSPTSSDPMNDAKIWGWPVGTDAFTSVRFDDGAMLLTGLQDIPGWRLNALPGASNVYIEMVVQTQQCQGSDNYGIIFHVPVLREADRGNLFAVSCDGRYRLTQWDGKAGENGESKVLIPWKTNAAIQSGPDRENRLGVMVKSDVISLYLNGTLLEQVTDKTYPGGHFGVFINAGTTENFTLKVLEMNFWNLGP